MRQMCSEVNNQICMSNNCRHQEQETHTHTHTHKIINRYFKYNNNKFKYLFVCY